MNPVVWALLLSSLGLGTTLTFASSHWLLAWMGLELNTLAILPLMTQQHHPRAAEAATKYFITQAAAAAMILFACTMNAWKTGLWNIDNLLEPFANNVLMMALALKTGIAPMHFWVPEVIQGLDLTTGLFVLTWQKLAPFILIIQTAQNINPELLTVLAITSATVGGWGALNQTQLRKIMAYSSIAHMGWMIVIIQYAPQLALIALSIYIILTAATFLTLKTFMSTKVNMLSTAWSKNPTLMTVTALTLLSLGGLPPLTGFMSKWLILLELTKQNMFIIATIMVMASMITLYIYLRLIYILALTIFPNTTNSTTPWRTKTSQKTLPLAMFTTAAIGLLPMTPAALMMFY
uniref:NADH-ubiquinone oxidoreductase chain 2 n=1 Tax=Clypeobarbus pleuropholis TaxID=643461 RepID=A0A1E1FMQ0_9TELE|nr:NADH dehydrogenase subunit 2 [Clypeobarbus pleuropholis]BAV71784.1 NADH dehydrogenase subunit 2 [Clypeobarbus pleuropholis]